MLKEQAISLLTQVKKIILGSESWLDSVHQPIEEAFSMAIQAIKSTQSNASNVLNALDTISRKAAVEALCKRCDLVSDDEPCTEECNDIKILRLMPSAQPEITLESAIGYLHEIGWMQEHDRILTESAQPEHYIKFDLDERTINELKELMRKQPLQWVPAQPEIIRCRNCKYAHLTYDGDCKGCDNLISRQTAIDDIETVNPSMPLSVNWVKNWIKTLSSAQPELIERSAYIRGFEQGRTQGMIDSQGGKNMIKAEWTNADALNLQPTCNQLATDCISRQAAIIIPILPKEHREYQTMNLDDAYELGWFDCQKCVEDLPSAQPEQKKGKWIDHSDDGYVECPFCGSATNCDDNINELHYCFSCGAKMEV